MDQWIRIESPQINPHTYDQLIFDKGGKNDTMEKRQSLQLFTCKSMKIEHSLTPYTKVN